MGNRVNRLQTTDYRQQTKKLSVFLLFSLWSLVFGLFSAQGAERIISLNACADELLLQLVSPDQIVGVTNLNHSEVTVRVLAENPHILRLKPDPENIIRLRPSLVLAGPFSNPLLIQQLEKMQIKVMHLAIPKNWDELQIEINRLAPWIQNSEKQKTALKRIEEIAGLKASSPWRGKRAVFWSAAGHLSGKETFEDTFLSALGMVNADSGEGYRFVSLERLIELRPEVIVVTQKQSHKNSWSHETLFHPALKKALPGIEYLHIPEEAVSCASVYTLEVAENLLIKSNS